MIRSCRNRHLHGDMSGRIRDDRRSDLYGRALDSEDPQHFVRGILRFIGSGTGHNDVSCGFVRNIFRVLTQHRQPKEFDPGKDQQKEDWQNDREFNRLRSSSART